MWLVRVGLKNKAKNGGGKQANGYAARQNGRGIWLYNQLPATAF